MIAWSAKQRALQAAILDDAVDIGTPVIAPGPVQSGKSVAAFYGWLAWAAMSYAGHDFGLASRSQRQFEAVSLKYVQEFARTSGLGFYRRADHWEMGSTYGPAPNRFYAFIGNDRASEGKARGPSFAGVLFDEVTLMPPDFVDTLLDRCSVPGAKAVMTCNPGGPMHWVKTTYLDEAGQAVHLPFELSDNPSLSQAYIDGLMQRYSGAMLRRMVFGEWAATEGVIYPNTGKVVGDHPPLHTAWRFDLAADYADSSVTHALLMAQLPGRRPLGRGGVALQRPRGGPPGRERAGGAHRPRPGGRPLPGPRRRGPRGARLPQGAGGGAAAAHPPSRYRRAARHPEDPRAHGRGHAAHLSRLQAPGPGDAQLPLGTSAPACSAKTGPSRKTTTDRTPYATTCGRAATPAARG